MGTVIEGPTEFYSGRLDAKQRRKATLTEQLLADPEVTEVGHQEGYTDLKDMHVPDDDSVYKESGAICPRIALQVLSYNSI
jgi:hypothetical protein